MRHFTSITQLKDLSKALEAAKYVKENPFADQELGKNKTLLMIFQQVLPMISRELPTLQETW